MSNKDCVRGFGKANWRPTKRVGALALAAVMTCSLSFPSFAFATVTVDETELAQGENTVGGGTATLTDSSLDMVGVTAGQFYTDESLSVNFNGGNNINNVIVEGSAEVDLSFSGENEVEEVRTSDNSNVTINANGHNEFEEVEAYGQSNLTINVTGTNEFEEISGFDDANVTIRGTECQKKDIINLGEDEQDTNLTTERGTLTIDHATVNLEGEESVVGSFGGDVRIDTSKIANADDGKYTFITASGTMLIRESVIDIEGTIYSEDKMTIEHSDVKAKEPDSKYGDMSPYRVVSQTGIELINEKNGKVREGNVDDLKVWYVDTDDNDGKEVDLKADGEPAYYKCANDKPESVKAMPKTNDGTSPIWPLAAGIASVATAAYATKRREEQQ